MAINLIVDAIIVLILIIGIILGVKRGFVATVAKPVRILASIGVAFGLCKPLSAQYVQPWIQEPLTEKWTAFLKEKCGEITAESASTELPGIMKLIAKLFNVDVNDVAEQATTTIVEAISNALAEPLASLAGIVLSFVGLFLATNIVCWILFKIIDLIFNVGPLEVINKIFGLIFGAVFSFIVVWALTVGFDYVITLGFLSDVEMIQGFTGGPVYKLVQQLNPIDLLFKF